MTRGVEPFEYLHLPPTERLMLAQEIIDSVVAEATPFTPEQLAELDRRCADLDAGRVQCVPWDEVRDEFLRGG